jgi:hypothetical protein
MNCYCDKQIDVILYTKQGFIDKQVETPHGRIKRLLQKMKTMFYAKTFNELHQLNQCVDHIDAIVTTSLCDLCKIECNEVILKPEPKKVIINKSF